MKHKHAELIKLKADGVRIERLRVIYDDWITAQWSDFSLNHEFRIAPEQTPDADGWIPWFGGENPAVGKRVDIKFQHDSGELTVCSDSIRWDHVGNGGDITHYRIAKEKVKEKVKKWRWMFFYPAPIHVSPIYVSEPFTEDEAAKYFADSVRQRVVPEWKMEVECDE